MAVRTPVAAIPKPRDVTPEGFEAEVVRGGVPVVIRGLAEGFPARRWNFPDVASHLPGRNLHASGVTPEDELTVRSWEFSREEIGRLLCGETLPAGGAGREAASLRPDWLFNVLRDLPELLPELPPPPVYRGRFQYRLFMGRKTKTPGHYHSYQHAMICQIHGTKRVLLHPPSDFSRLYPFPLTAESSHYQSSQVDFAEPDLARFPKAARAHAFEAMLEPGDALFIPVHWWHAVYGAGPVLSTSLFWNASLRDYRFPEPGFRTLAGMLRFHLWPRLRGATGAAS